MTELAAVSLDADRAPEIAAFTRVGTEFDLLTTGSVRRAVFADPGPQGVWGHYGAGLEAVCAAVVRGERGFVKLLSVHPRIRRHGLGRALLAHAEAFCLEGGATSMEVGGSAPYYVVPGVDVRSTEAICLLEASGYERSDDAVNLGVPLRDLPEPPLEVRRGAEADLEALGWVADEHPQWVSELERGLALGTCIAHGGLGFCCYDVNRDGWLGPIATHPDHRGGEVGASTLLGTLHAMAEAGYTRAEVAWAAALPFYAKTCGARVSRVFWCYRKALQSGR